MARNSSCNGLCNGPSDEALHVSAGSTRSFMEPFNGVSVNLDKVFPLIDPLPCILPSSCSKVGVSLSIFWEKSVTSLQALPLLLLKWLVEPSEAPSFL